MYETSNGVAPHGGAWIETDGHQARGNDGLVAPHGGAWIETLCKHGLFPPSFVAPHGGAWIETLFRFFFSSLHRSPLTEGRGLKR